MLWFQWRPSMQLSSLTSCPHRNSKQNIFHAPSSCSFHTLCFWMPTHFSLWRHGQMSWHLSPRWSPFQRCFHVAHFIARHLNVTFDPFQQFVLLQPQSLHLDPPFLFSFFFHLLTLEPDLGNVWNMFTFCDRENSSLLCLLKMLFSCSDLQTRPLLHFKQTVCSQFLLMKAPGVWLPFLPLAPSSFPSLPPSLSFFPPYFVASDKSAPDMFCPSRLRTSASTPFIVK